MNFNFYSHGTFEPWDFRNPETVGIGGSETSHIEMCRRLAERGHDVMSYAPIGSLKPETPIQEMGPGGVPWVHCDYADFSRKGVWVVYRHPPVIDQIPAEGNSIWLICQDVDYGPEAMTPERCKKLTRIVALCQEHAKYLKEKYPFAAEKVCVSSNGITPLAFVENIERNPHRLIYTSSPDRGLMRLLPIFGRVKEIIPDAELHIYYGWDNMDKVIARENLNGANPPGSGYTGRIKDKLLKLIEQTGAMWHGRTPQKELAKAFMQSAICAHPNIWHGRAGETSCISSMEAQAYGAIPITYPTWAIAENVEHGVFIQGSPEEEPMSRAKFVFEIVKMMLDPERQETIRREMMPWARKRFDWGNFVVQWERWAEKDQAITVGSPEQWTDVEVTA
jgi:glycosyltransferase involved in cell wall biosynthesis